MISDFKDYLILVIANCIKVTWILKIREMKSANSIATTQILCSLHHSVGLAIRSSRINKICD